MTGKVEACEGLPAEWTELAGDAPMLATPGWLRAMRGRLGPRPVTFLLREPTGVSVAAFASVQTAPRPGEFFDLHHVMISPTPWFPLTEESRAGRARLAATAPPPQHWVPNLVVMLPGYECLPVGPRAQDPTALGILVSGIVDWAARQGIPTVAFLYTRPEQWALGAALAGHGFTTLPLTYTWELHLPGTGMADYFAALPRKRRKEARREFRTMAESGVDIRQADTLDVFDELVRLRCQLVGKYRGAADPANEARRLRQLIDDVARGQPTVFLASAAGKPVGFALFALHQKIWQCLAVGYEYDDPRSRLTYFGTAFYTAAEAAYAGGIRTLGYGQGAWQAKRARGCRPTAMTGWIHSTEPTLAAAARASAEITELLALDGASPDDVR